MNPKATLFLSLFSLLFAIFSLILAIITLPSRHPVSDREVKISETSTSETREMASNLVTAIVGPKFEANCAPGSNPDYVLEESRFSGTGWNSYSYYVYENERYLGTITLTYYENSTSDPNPMIQCSDPQIAP